MDGVETALPLNMLHHLSFAVADLARSAAFYDAALLPLGYERVWADSTAVGYGPPGGGDKFAIRLRPGRAAAPVEGFHVAFAAPSHKAVDAFYGRGAPAGRPGQRAAGMVPGIWRVLLRGVRDRPGWLSHRGGHQPAGPLGWCRHALNADS